MKKIFLCLIIVSAILQADFSRSTRGVVTDNVTSLQWQDDVVPEKIRWQAGIEYCEALSLDGGGWRLPNINELTSIVDDSAYDPAINTIFVNILSGAYWSSTSSSHSSLSAWNMNLSLGNHSFVNKTYTYYIRCVRAGL